MKQKKYSKYSVHAKSRNNTNTLLYISDHAKRRLYERLHCKPGKFMKVIGKAWKSKEKVNEDILRRIMNGPGSKEGDDIKYYMGYIFIFRKLRLNGLDRKMLITLFNPKRRD